MTLPFKTLLHILLNLAAALSENKSSFSLKGMFRCLKIGVTHTPTIGLSHTPSIGVSQTDFEATGKYHLNNLNRPLKTTKTTVFTLLPPLHATRTRIHRHRTPVSTTFLHSCLPPSHTRILLALSPASTSPLHPYQPRAVTRHFPRSND